MIEVTSRIVEQRGITLPWVRYDVQWTYGPPGQREPDYTAMATWPGERGEVFIPLDQLYELSEQGRWDSQFGSVLVLGWREGSALEQAGLAEQETKGGYHRTDALVEFLKET